MDAEIALAAAVSEWLTRAFESPEFGLAILPAALVLGFISAVGSGCNLAMIIAVAGYAGANEAKSRNNLYIISACFMIGTVVALTALGSLLGMVGEVAGKSLGIFGKVFAGLAAVTLGLIALDLFPFKLPSFNAFKGKAPEGVFGSIIFGFAIGIASLTCSLACAGPLLPVVIGMAVLKGQGIWGALIMFVFAIGYSLPLTAMILGVGIGKLSRVAGKSMKPVKLIAGVLLIGAGFWILTTI